MALLKRNKNPDAQTLRTFGLIGCGLALIFWFKFFRGGNETAAQWSLVCGALLLPGFFWRRWMGFWFVVCSYAARPPGFVLSHLLMLVAFYGVITPMGLLMRLFGYDPLRRSRKKPDTFWQVREGSRSATSYFKQY